MKITLISPPSGFDGQKSKGLPIAPPVLEYLAGLTTKVNPDIDIELIDANKEDFDPHMVEADLIGITVLTPQALWVYRTAQTIREIGKAKVVLGGMHVTVLPEEAINYADAIVIGEAESVWEELLNDFKSNSLKKFYKGMRQSLEGLPHPRTNLLKSYYPFRGFFTSRGCPHHCTFCSVRKFFGDTIRHRPIEDVVKEVVSGKHRLLMNIDDNIWGTNIRRSIELYRELAKNIRFKWWFGQADLATAQHERAGELLKWARRSGLTAVIVGWESNNPHTLNEFKASTKQGRNRREAIKKIRAAGIEVMLFIVIGGINDTFDDFKRTLEVCDELKVSAHPVMITPFPGTELYDSYKKYMFDNLDWSVFDGNHALFKHSDKSMSVESREQALIKLRAELFTMPRILSRIKQISLKGFPMAHITSFMVQYPQGRSFKEYAKRQLK